MRNTGGGGHKYPNFCVITKWMPPKHTRIMTYKGMVYKSKYSIWAKK